MSRRRQVQQQQERAYVAHFLAWFNQRHRSNFEVVAEPNPPEAVVQSLRKTCWVEVGAAYWTAEYARDIHSYATPGEAHQPVEDGPCMNMDSQFAQSFVAVLKKKLENESYIACCEKYGPGYLIIPVYYPWFNGETISHMREAWAQTLRNDLRCFRRVFVAYPSLNELAFLRWRI